MKLDEYLIGDAIDTRNWDVAIKLLMEQFDIPEDAASLVLEEHIAPHFGREINIRYNYHIYTWHEDAGFLFRKVKNKNKNIITVWARPI